MAIRIINDPVEVMDIAKDIQAKPAKIKSSDKGTVLALLFPGYNEDDLEEISWEQWIDVFKKKKMTLYYDDENNYYQFSFDSGF